MPSTAMSGLLIILSAKMKMMKFEVLSSIRMAKERLNYKEHLAKYTWQWMDNLDMMPGKYKELGRGMVVAKLDERGESWSTMLC